MASSVPLSPVGSNAVGLQADVFARAFPFHVACDAALRVTQAGASLTRIATGLRAGVSLAQEFECVRPALELAPETLAAHQDKLVFLRHRISGVRLRGQWMRTTDPSGWVFLGSPWFASASALKAAGLTLKDFAPHDAVAELLTLEQTQRISMDDLQRLNEQLSRQRETLKHTESLYRSAIAAANAVVFQEDFMSDTFTFVGEGFEALTGFKPEELRPSELRARELLAEDDDRNADSTRLLHGLSGRRRREYQLRTRSGERRWISEASVVVTDAAGSLTTQIGILYDVSARQQAQDRLRASEQESRHLALVAARTHNAVALMDLDRKIVWVNEGFTRITGYAPEEMIGQLPRGLLVGPKTDMATYERLVQSFETGQGMTVEILFYARDRRPYWALVELQPMLDEDGKLTGFMSIQADITSRKNYEQRLAELHGELDAILRVIPSGIVAFDAQQWVTYCNASFASMIDRPVGSLLGMHSQQVDAILAGLCAPDDAPRRIADLNEKGSDVIRLVRPAPAVITRDAREILDATGRRKWQVVHLRDITRETEVDRMKSEFLATAAHELRTPMTSVHGFAELLTTDDFDTETARTIARTILRQSSLLVQMVNELLDLARIEAGGGRDFAFRTQPLAPIVRETIDGLLVPDDPRRAEMPSGAGYGVLVSVDAAQLRRALINVLSNAHKYSRGRGSIRVSLPERSQGGRAEVGIRVEDEGIGMSPEQLRRVFERFYRADPGSAIQGTGLGMTLVKEIIEALHGSIEVSSQPARGTAVTLWLPVAVST